MPCQECFWELIGLLKALRGVFSLPLCPAIPILIFWGLWWGCCHLTQQTPTSSVALALASCFVSVELLLLPLEAPTSLPSLSDSLALPSWSLCQGLAWCLCLSVTARTRVRKWGCWLQHLTFILLSFGELPLRRWSWKLRFHALFWQLSHKYPVSSLTVWRFVYVSVTEIEQKVFVCRFSAPSNYWMAIRFGLKLALMFPLFLPVLEIPAKWKLCACPAALTAYHRFSSYSVPSHGCQVNKVWGVLWKPLALTEPSLYLKRQMMPWLTALHNRGVLPHNLLGHLGSDPELFTGIAWTPAQFEC